MIKLIAPSPDQIQVITFDCYGTLVDWETGIWTAFREAAAADGVPLEREQVVARYHAIEAMVEKGGYRPYREVLAESARRVAAECGWSISRETGEFLTRSLPHWPPFPDTGPALERMAERYRMGILSNVDEDLLEQTCDHFPIDFDFWVTADRVESYKPDLAHFEAARPFVGDPSGWLHVAQSLYHDVAPARCVGVPVVWVNRKSERLAPEAPPPAREVHDLAALADWLGL
jgi:2-haloalkanoic acid dehalogenase type II